MDLIIAKPSSASRYPECGQLDTLQCMLSESRIFPTQDLPEIPKVYDAIDWKHVPIHPSEEPLVPLGIGSEYPIFTSAMYYGEHDNSPYRHGQLAGSVITMFVRQSVAQKLVAAQQHLPPNLMLIVFDAWRPLSVQSGLYDVYYNELHKLHPDMSPKLLENESRKYVCPPSDSIDYPPPHSTGGTIDVGIIQLPPNISSSLTQTTQPDQAWARAILENAQQLDFGTAFDWGGEESALRYFEDLAKSRQLTEEEASSQQNRRLLYYTMDSVGFIPNPHEWWHFNAVETQIGAKTIGLRYATYGQSTLSALNKQHEATRIKTASSIGKSSHLPRAAICKPPDSP